MSGNPGQNRNTDKLADLDRRIDALRDAGKPKPRADKGKFDAMSYGWRMIIELVVSVMAGAAMGWGLDHLLGTLPGFLIVMTLLGFAAGVRTMLRSAEEMQRRQGNAPPPAPPNVDEKG